MNLLPQEVETYRRAMTFHRQTITFTRLPECFRKDWQGAAFHFNDYNICAGRLMVLMRAAENQADSLVAMSADHFVEFGPERVRDEQPAA